MVLLVMMALCACADSVIEIERLIKT